MPKRMNLQLATVICLIALVATKATTTPDTQEESKKVNPRWLDRINKEDRRNLEQRIGFAPPEFTSNLKWYNHEPMDFSKLRGKVVFIQTWTSKTAAGRNWVMRAPRLLEDYNPDDVVLVAIHTPQGTATVDKFLERRELKIPIAIDADGSFCDGLGAYKRPVNILIDRNGTTRYNGLTRKGLKLALAELVAEEHDPLAKPKSRPASQVVTNTDFPSFTGKVSSAKDIRGQRAPDMYVSQWLNSKPDTAGKVVVIDFWATWCPPCVASIPHTNELADQFRDDVAIIGISAETDSKFQTGLNKLYASKGINLDTIRYHLALDSSRTMTKALQVRSIPHVIVISSDWIVRWQGNPKSLSANTLGQIVAANRSLNGSSAKSKGRWANERKK